MARRVRRFWSDDEKRRIVAQSYAPGVSVSVVGDDGKLALARLIRETARLSPDFERAGGVVQRLCGAGA